jgi:hypothetical protein
MTKTTETAAGTVTLLPTRLAAADVVSGWKARWGIGRMRMTVAPGLYGVGRPGPDSPVLVTANYRLTLDSLRRELTGVDAWILVLDTKGINVWCAAGKGTFGTEEVIGRVLLTHLKEVVSHRRLVLPQLGAPGVAAHVVTRHTGFAVVYGPVRAADIPRFLRDGMRKDDGMSRVRFDLRDRLAVVPIELVGSWKVLLPAVLLAAVTGALERRAVDARVLLDAVPFVLAVLAGAALTPALLPFLPFRSFSLKGAAVGLAATSGWVAATGMTGWDAAFVLLAGTAVCSFLAINFTGASTYTSQSGVLREMKAALPVLIAATLLGVAARLVGVARAFLS